MNAGFQPNGLAMLIGSQPLNDHAEACELVLAHTPEILNWVQLPIYKQEGMVDQFMAGLPGLVQGPDRNYVHTEDGRFDDQMLAFFEEYLQVAGQETDWDQSRFVLTPQVAQGYFTLLDALKTPPGQLQAVKGQVTGPVTFCTAMHDHEGRAIFYHEALREAAVKLLALKAAWQASQLSRTGLPVIVFIDEPALAGYGSSELISISREDISACLQEVVEAIHDQGALAGVHVCANTDWSLLLDSKVDIINFDAHGYFDKLILYADQLKAFIRSGRFLAWGLVPTLDPEQIEATTEDTLWQDWKSKSQQIVDLGIGFDILRAQSFITPSCGTGSLTPELNLKVLSLTQGLSRRIRES